MAGGAGLVAGRAGRNAVIINVGAAAWHGRKASSEMLPPRGRPPPGKASTALQITWRSPQGPPRSAGPLPSEPFGYRVRAGRFEKRKNGGRGPVGLIGWVNTGSEQEPMPIIKDYSDARDAASWHPILGGTPVGGTRGACAIWRSHNSKQCKYLRTFLRCRPWSPTPWASRPTCRSAVEGWQTGQASGKGWKPDLRVLIVIAKQVVGPRITGGRHQHTAGHV